MVQVRENENEASSKANCMRGNTFASIVVFLSGVYLLGLASLAFARPNLTRRFLAGFASTRLLHFVEMGLRLLIGAAFVLYAPKMALQAVFSVVGWILIVTTVVLLFVPWKLHRRFAEWSVPMATKRMLLLGFGSYIAGVFILFCLFCGHDASLISTD
mgnify:CR=1 FL=1